MHRVEVYSVHPGYRSIGDKTPHKCRDRKRVAALPASLVPSYCPFFSRKFVSGHRRVVGPDELRSLRSLRSSLVPLIGPENCECRSRSSSSCWDNLRRAERGEIAPLRPAALTSQGKPCRSFEREGGQDQIGQQRCTHNRVMAVPVALSLFDAISPSWLYCDRDARWLDGKWVI
jgi:hypothetical protein